jgi:REP element-mobilizing transposase RayT
MGRHPYRYFLNIPPYLFVSSLSPPLRFEFDSGEVPQLTRPTPLTKLSAMVGVLVGFSIVLLPDHLHCIWTLPPQDYDYATRWRLIKTFVTKSCENELHLTEKVTVSKQKRKEKNLWQIRFWEHLIRDEIDFAQHCDYTHYNPVKHGLCKIPREWEFSSIHRFVAQSIYSEDWGVNNTPEVLIETAGE